MAINNGGGSEEGALQTVLYMWGYLPGALPQRTPLLTPVAVRVPPCDYSWNDVCGGGCGFAIAISGVSLFLCSFFFKKKKKNWRLCFPCGLVGPFCFFKNGLDLKIKQV